MDDAMLPGATAEISPRGEVEVRGDGRGQKDRCLQERLEVGYGVDVRLPPSPLELIDASTNAVRPSDGQAAHAPRTEAFQDDVGFIGCDREQGNQEVDR